MFQVFLFTLIILKVQGQDYLTCLRNNDSFVGLTTSGTPFNIKGDRGQPGKRGAEGAKGDVGMKGLKGEPGQQATSVQRQLRTLQGTIRSQIQMFHALQTKTRQLCQVMQGIAVPAGWYRSSNGYYYKLITTEQSWQESRNRCQEMGGDLAAAGIKDATARRLILGALPQSQQGIWIGLSDIAQEGTWIWIDGTPLTNAGELWRSGEPNNSGGIEDCALLVRDTINRANDDSCAKGKHALCEWFFPLSCS